MSHQNPFQPTAPSANLRLRAEMLRSLRELFHREGYLEVETPILSRDVVVDRFLDPFEVSPDAGDPQAVPFYLQTSPEAGMKRLLAVGSEAIYQVSRVFRWGESGKWHNPEFTLVEWYRPGDGMAEQFAFLSRLCQQLLQAPPAVPLTYAAAFEQHVGVEPHTASVAELAAAATRLGLTPPPGLEQDDRDLWLNWLLATAVEPHLGQEAPAILHDYPASQAALAVIRRVPGKPAVAERFELYCRGLELANGFHELLDADELEERTARENELRERDGKAPLPGPSRLIEAMRCGLPDCTGVALGFDRLVMLACGAESIDEVIAFPFDRA